MYQFTLKPHPKLVNGSLRFVGVITRGTGKTIATTLLCDNFQAGREAAEALVRAIKMSANRSGLHGWITPSPTCVETCGPMGTTSGFEGDLYTTHIHRIVTPSEVRSYRTYQILGQEQFHRDEGRIATFYTGSVS